MKLGEVANEKSIYWEGIYNEFGDIDIDLPYNESAWICNVRNRMLVLKNQDPYITGQRTNRIIPNHLLPMIALMDGILHKKREVYICDIGGGMGDNYSLLSYWYPKEARNLIDYTIVDTVLNCNEGRKLELPGKIKWIESTGKWKELLRAINKIDVVILCSTLQYIPEWKEVLMAIEESGCKYIYITRTPMQTDRKTFYSKQYVVPGNEAKYQGECIGVNVSAIFNKKELIDLITKDDKYRLDIELFHSYCDMKRFSFRNEVKVFYENLIFENVM